MTAINHALTGALIGLTVSHPVLAVPLAFVSHFALDAMPHYDPPGDTHEERIDSKTFLWVQLIAGFILCVSLVGVLFFTHPAHWLNAAVCAFIATTPDMYTFPRYVSVKRTGKDLPREDWGLFGRIHNRVQWKTAPIFGWLEAAWFVGATALLWQFL
jgi:hypothetical protein